MNSVMDDNKMLTLINGKRISLTASMSLLFEVEDLSVASPATVSRAGMIYVDNDLGWKPSVKSWLCKQFKSNDDRSFVSSLCDKVSFLIDEYSLLCLTFHLFGKLTSCFVFFLNVHVYSTCTRFFYSRKTTVVNQFASVISLLYKHSLHLGIPFFVKC